MYTHFTGTSAAKYEQDKETGGEAAASNKTICLS
jgi:hypothetical protein